MGKKRVIPEGYMTVGEIAGKMGVTVRAMQYYDKEGVLSPSAESDGGLRLYTNKDIVKLHQIQSMKKLGFSLEDIKTRLPSIDSPEEVSSVLTMQAEGLAGKISALKNALEAVEKLNIEVSQMEAVDWAKYADIIVTLQEKNDSYGMMKHFENKLSDHIHSRFDKTRHERISGTLKRLNKEVAELKEKGLSPESAQGQALAKDWWDMVMDFTDGDMSLLPELSKLAYSLGDSEKKDTLGIDLDFVDKAVTAYYTNLGYNPFDEEE